MKSTVKKTLVCMFALGIGISCFTACDNTNVEASWKEGLAQKVVLGEMIDFSSYVEYTEGAEWTMTYSTPSMENIPYNSMYFTSEEVGTHDFKFTFTIGKKSTELHCSINIVAPAPEVEASKSAVSCELNETVSFDDLFNRSDIIAIPSGYVDVVFNSVTYFADYSKEGVLIENKTESEVVETAFVNGETSYTFEEYGKYVFDISIKNTEGIVDTTLQVSVANQADMVVPEGMQAQGVVFGEEENTVQLMRASDSANLSYVAFDASYALNRGDYYKITTEFKGKNAPQLMFFADKLNGNVLLGKGYIASLEFNSTTTMGIYGPNRLASPKATTKNSFGRDKLKAGKIYRWEFIFGVSSDGTKNMVQAFLYEQNADGTFKKVATHNWENFVAGTDNNGYIVFLGSTYDDIIFRFVAPEKYEVK